jgi:succinyl-CoA synthetase alpha subunit
VTLNRPEAANALTGKLRGEVDRIIDDLEADDQTRAVLIGLGPAATSRRGRWIETPVTPVVATMVELTNLSTGKHLTADR